MSVKIKNIELILAEKYKLKKTTTPVFEWKDYYNSSLKDQAVEIYQKLGGIGDPDFITSTGYQLEYEDFTLILDEEKSFNRYRGVTLSAPFYLESKILPLEKYKNYCKVFEKECLKAGSAGLNWSSRVSEEGFGKGDENGDLYKSGAPMWKYRAFQEYLTDISTLTIPVKLIRISVWENIMFNKNMYRLNDILLSSRPDYKNALLKFCERKIQEIFKEGNKLKE